MDLIDRDKLIEKAYFHGQWPDPGNLYPDGKEAVDVDDIEDAPTVDAVPVDQITLHHILIDENGIPEVKLQFGERILILRRVDDPLDIMEVVHGRWETHKQVDSVFCCSVCKMNVSDFERRWLNYCPNCGAKNGW